MITFRAKPLTLSLSISPSIGFVAKWALNASAYKELQLERADEISINFLPEVAAQEVWEYVLGRKYDGKPGAIGTMVVVPDNNIHEVTIGASDADFTYMRDHFFDLIAQNVELVIGLFLRSAERTSIGATYPFGIRPKISFVVREK